MYLVKTPQFIQNLFPNFIWKIADAPKSIFLTFDDGPIPEVTPWVLDQLDQYNAKATFFCVGENIDKHPDIFKKLSENGHSLGSHTYNHLSGWTTDNIPYYHNVRHCANLVKSELFRPPYGRLRPKQAQFLQRHYKIVMWDVLSADFDPEITDEQCLDNVISNASDGSIVVFHDSLKAQKKLKYALPKVLAHFSALGYEFKAIQQGMLANKKQALISV